MNHHHDAGDNELRGKNGTIWSKSPPPDNHKRRKQVVIHGTVGPTRQSKMESIRNSFKMFVINEMIDIIVREANRETQGCFKLRNDAHPDNRKRLKVLTTIEFVAFSGLLLLSAGVNRAGIEALQEMWAVKNGRPIFRDTMSYDRFREIFQYVRFDNKDTRESAVRTTNLLLFAIFGTCLS